MEDLAGYQATFTVDRFVGYEHLDGTWVQDREFTFAAG
jgi:hypothetical protein